MKPLSATVPVTGDTSSVTDVIDWRGRCRSIDGDVERGRGRTLIASRIGRLGRQRVAARLKTDVVIV